VTNERGTKSIARPLVRLFNSSSTTQKVILLLAALSVTSGFAATTSKVNRNICAISDEDAAGMSGDLGTDIGSLRDYTETVARLLKTGKFEQLDCLADHARSG
jgi:hypothetical protein